MSPHLPTTAAPHRSNSAAGQPDSPWAVPASTLASTASCAGRASSWWTGSLTTRSGLGRQPAESRPPQGAARSRTPESHRSTWRRPPACPRCLHSASLTMWQGRAWPPIAGRTSAGRSLPHPTVRGERRRRPRGRFAVGVLGRRSPVRCPVPICVGRRSSVLARVHYYQALTPGRTVEGRCPLEAPRVPPRTSSVLSPGLRAGPRPADRADCHALARGAITAVPSSMARR
jgi:hypothetical protein